MRKAVHLELSTVPEYMLLLNPYARWRYIQAKRAIMEAPVNITEKRLANFSFRGNQQYTTSMGPATTPTTPIALPKTSRMNALV